MSMSPTDCGAVVEALNPRDRVYLLPLGFGHTAAQCAGALSHVRQCSLLLGSNSALDLSMQVSTSLKGRALSGFQSREEAEVE